jgi:hypothetical protein
VGIGFHVEGFTAKTASWSYSGFNRFRELVASKAGISLDSMVGFGGQMAWEDLAGEALLPLLNHSDCDGELTPEECKTVAPRLRELAPQLKDRSYNYDECHALLLADMMDFAAKVGKPLIFC